VRRALSKEDLMKALWPDSFEEESNLTQQISMMRKDTVAYGELAFEFSVNVDACEAAGIIGGKFSARPLDRELVGG
jgi:hypothetical protein